MFRRVRPAVPLRDIVESIWLQEDSSFSDARTPSCVLPTGTIEVLFHYGDRFAHVEAGRVETVPRFYVTGQRTRPVFTLAGKRIGIVIASLYPWGLRSLFPECADAVDGYVDLELLSGRSQVARIEHRLLEATDSETRIRLVEAFLLSQRTEGVGDIRMVAASGMLAMAATARPVHEISRRFSMSRRHFSRKFRSTIGIQPKTFSRIMRFQKAIRSHRDRGLCWATVAAECGYSDQAHLSHEVKRFSARTPGEFGVEPTRATDVFNGNSVSKFFNTIYVPA
jgi:AraC-like DNA-binding protein